MIGKQNGRQMSAGNRFVKITAALLAVCIWTCMLPQMPVCANEEMPDVVYYGDVDGDADVTAVDALHILRFVVRLAEPREWQEMAADVNGDGAVGADDALQVLQYVVYLILVLDGTPQTPATNPVVSDESGLPQELLDQGFLEGSTYVLNTSTMKFHYPDCSAAKRISEKNYAETDGPRDLLISYGYSPCGICKP